VHTFSLDSYNVDRAVPSAKQDLTWSGMIEEDQRVIAEVSWVGEDALLVKEVDRASRVGHVVLFQGGEREGNVVRQLGKDGEEGDDGWIDHVSYLLPLVVFKLTTRDKTSGRSRGISWTDTSTSFRTVTASTTWPFTARPTIRSRFG